MAQVLLLDTFSCACVRCFDQSKCVQTLRAISEKLADWQFVEKVTERPVKIGRKF
jgi:hypothetical protein